MVVSRLNIEKYIHFETWNLANLMEVLKRLRYLLIVI